MSETYTVIELPHEQALEFFPSCVAMIQRGLEHDPYGRTQVLDIYRQLQEGWAKVIVIHDESELRGVAVAQLYQQPSDGAAVLHVASLAGEHMDKWLPELLLVLQTIAQEQRCDAVTCVGRKGWQRMLKPHGFELDAISMRKKVETQVNELRQESATQR